MSDATFDTEGSLPRVPLPTLEQSCARFLEWCAPLLGPGELASTEAAVTQFLRPDSPARTLQAELERYDATDGVASWLDDFWAERYLGRRDRIALDANFFFLFQDASSGQLERAAGLIVGALDYKRAIDDGTLPVRVQRGQPLSMEQCKYLFSATRIPGSVRDSARTPYTEQWAGPSRARHIVVCTRGRMFRMDVLGPHGRPHSLEELQAGLCIVLTSATDRGSSVGHLTTTARAEWAVSRAALLAHDPANADALETIETALFCVCLEDGAPDDALDACDQLLHGDSGNRWYDKALSFIVFADGTAGLNGEHCHLDGVTIVSLIDAMLDDTVAEHARSSGAHAQGAAQVTPIEFVLDEGLHADVRHATVAFAEYAARTATTTVRVDDFGSDAVKALGMSPDAFVQMAFQLGHHRAKGRTGSTYESISTRHFREGRTEAIRVVTPQSVQFVSAMDDPQVDDDARRGAFEAAAEAHSARARQCQAGDAPEQHLWELQMLGRRVGEDVGEPLALYDSPGWNVMRADYLSTSGLASLNVQYFGFGATSDTCIGVGYALLPDRLHLYLSTPRSVAGAMQRFADHVRSVVGELADLLSR